jgi:hypothetical protein
MSKRVIPNPMKLTAEERLFVHSSNTVEKKKSPFKGRMISMSDDFFDELNEYLRLNPTEGSRSSFMVRIVAEYIRNK